jgi:hypothetical protein
MVCQSIRTPWRMRERRARARCAERRARREWQGDKPERQQRPGLALPASASGRPWWAPALSHPATAWQRHRGDAVSEQAHAGADQGTRHHKRAGQSVRVVCFQRLGPSAGGPTEVPIYYKGVLRLESSSAFAFRRAGNVCVQWRQRSDRTCQSSSSASRPAIRAHEGTITALSSCSLQWDHAG